MTHRQVITTPLFAPRITEDEDEVPRDALYQASAGGRFILRLYAALLAVVLVCTLSDAWAYSAGQKIQVDYHGDWIDAEVISEDPKSGVLAKFHPPFNPTYTDQSYFAVPTHVRGASAAGNAPGISGARTRASERVQPLPRISAQPAVQPAAPAPTPSAGGGVGTLPIGTYVVRTYSAGVNYRPGPVTWYFYVEAGNRYRAQGTTGTFTVSDGSITWSGGMHANGDWLNPSPYTHPGYPRVVFKKSKGGRDTVIGSKRT